MIFSLLSLCFVWVQKADQKDIVTVVAFCWVGFDVCVCVQSFLNFIFTFFMTSPVPKSMDMSNVTQSNRISFFLSLGKVGNEPHT